MNQKGFATLEIIFVIMIISTLAFIAVPKIDRVLDKIFLDYEMKRFCAELDFVSSLNRNASFNSKIFTQANPTANEIILQLDSNSYQLKKNGKNFRDKHFLAFGIKINFPFNFRQIKFNSEGKCLNNSGTIILTSRRGEKAEIIFDSVGRWRGDRNVE